MTQLPAGKNPKQGQPNVPARKSQVNPVNALLRFDDATLMSANFQTFNWTPFEEIQITLGIARDASNPKLQIQALRYLTERRRDSLKAAGYVVDAAAARNLMGTGGYQHRFTTQGVAAALTQHELIDSQPVEPTEATEAAETTEPQTEKAADIESAGMEPEEKGKKNDPKTAGAEQTEHDSGPDNGPIVGKHSPPTSEYLVRGIAGRSIPAGNPLTRDAPEEPEWAGKGTA